MEHVLLQIRVPKHLRDTIAMIAASKGMSSAHWVRHILDTAAVAEWSKLQDSLVAQHQKKQSAIEKLTIVEEKPDPYQPLVDSMTPEGKRPPRIVRQ